MPFRESAQTANADSPGEREFEELTRITNELITTQRQLHKQSSELRRLNQEKNQAIGIVAHDLRNPLALIKMQAEVLLQELSGILSDEHCTLLQSITEQGTTMLTIVNDLLDVSAIEAGSFNIKLETVDVVGLIERFVQSQQLLSASKSIGIDFVKMPGTLFARVDPGKFLQVLGNLIGNAVKYSPPGSQVIVTLSRHPDTFEVRVQDFGPGIPADELESLFEPFKTASIVPSGDEKCTGLGLAIVRRIIEKHEGVFDVESQVDVGSVFSVRLPVGVSMQPNAAAVDCQSAAETLSAKSEDPKRLLRVLVVDDCKAAAKIMFRLIDRVCRSKIEIANDGATAFDLVVTFNPDLVFLDIEMPGIDGRQVAKQIREHLSTDAPMICAVTAHAVNELENISKLGCFDSVISKPIAIADLKRLLALAQQR